MTFLLCVLRLSLQLIWIPRSLWSCLLIHPREVEFTEFHRQSCCLQAADVRSWVGLIVRELEVLMSGDQVHPLCLPEYQKGAQSQVADDGHQVEHTGPGASGLNQVAT